MPFRVTEYVTTPNPNAVKCVLDASPGSTPRSYFSAAQAAGDPLARALFEVPGVVNLLIHDGWITVSKSSDANWKTIKKGVESVLASAGG
jgi:hypothetical protein